jgi:trehalose 6-phosphate synthase
MRTTLKIALPLIISVAAVSLLFAAYQVRTERRNLRNDLSRRSEVLAESLQETIEPLLERTKTEPDRAMRRLVERFGQREHLKGIAVYQPSGDILAITPGLSPEFRIASDAVRRALAQNIGNGQFLTVNDSTMHIYAVPLHRDAKTAGALAVIYDASYIDSRVLLTLRDALLSALLETLLITLLALLLVRWT